MPRSFADVLILWLGLLLAYAILDPQVFPRFGEGWRFAFGIASLVMLALATYLELRALGPSRAAYLRFLQGFTAGAAIVLTPILVFALDSGMPLAWRPDSAGTVAAVFLAGLLIGAYNSGVWSAGTARA